MRITEMVESKVDGGIGVEVEVSEEEGMAEVLEGTEEALEMEPRQCFVPRR